MPIYSWKCSRDGFEDEHIMSYDRSQNVEVICPHCGDAMAKQMPLVAKTATAWSGNWTEGMSHTYYSKALGRRVANRRQEEQILNAAGFVCETDLGEGFIEKQQSKVMEKRAEQDAKSDLYNEVLAETGDAVKAVEAAFPAHECLDGTLDALYDETITT